MLLSFLLHSLSVQLISGGYFPLAVPSSRVQNAQHRITDAPIVRRYPYHRSVLSSHNNVITVRHSLLRHSLLRYSASSDHSQSATSPVTRLYSEDIFSPKIEEELSPKSEAEPEISLSPEVRSEESEKVFLTSASSTFLECLICLQGENSDQLIFLPCCGRPAQNAGAVHRSCLRVWHIGLQAEDELQLLPCTRYIRKRRLAKLAYCNKRCVQCGLEGPPYNLQEITEGDHYPSASLQRELEIGDEKEKIEAIRRNTNILRQQQLEGMLGSCFGSIWAKGEIEWQGRVESRRREKAQRVLREQKNIVHLRPVKPANDDSPVLLTDWAIEVGRMLKSRFCSSNALESAD